MMHKQFVINGRACLAAVRGSTRTQKKCGKCRLTVTQLQKCNEYDAQTICDKRSCLLSSNVAVPVRKKKCGKCRLTVTQLQKCNEYDAQTICDKRSCLLSSNVAVPVMQGADEKKYMQQQIFNDKQR